jgi:hypothetical protein
MDDNLNERTSSPDSLATEATGTTAISDESIDQANATAAWMLSNEFSTSDALDALLEYIDPCEMEWSQPTDAKSTAGDLQQDGQLPLLFSPSQDASQPPFLFPHGADTSQTIPCLYPLAHPFYPLMHAGIFINQPSMTTSQPALMKSASAESLVKLSRKKTLGATEDKCCANCQTTNA